MLHRFKNMQEDVDSCHFLALRSALPHTIGGRGGETNQPMTASSWPKPLCDTLIHQHKVVYLAQLSDLPKKEKGYRRAINNENPTIHWPFHSHPFLSSNELIHQTELGGDAWNTSKVYPSSSQGMTTITCLQWPPYLRNYSFIQGHREANPSMQCNILSDRIRAPNHHRIE